MNTKPLVSVVLSVYNCEKYLAEAIDSILAQTWTDLEFVIVDDGSTDSTPDILSSYSDSRIKLISQKNRGLAPALNAGIQNALGKYIARMDADDISLPNRLEKQVEFMENNSYCSVLGSNALLIDMNGNYLYTSSVPLTGEKINSVLNTQSPFFHSSVIFRKDDFLKCGGYFEKIKHHFEDFILWHKMKQLGRLCNLEEPLIKYRIVPSAITNRDSKNASIMISLAKKIIAEGDLSNDDYELLNSITGKKNSIRLRSDYHSKIGCIYLYKRKKRFEALKNFILSFIYNPLNFRTPFFLFLSLLPFRLVARWMNLRGIENN